MSLSTETGLHSANCAADREDLTQVQFLVWFMRPLMCSDRCRGSDSTEFRGDSAVAVCSCGSSTKSSLSKGLLLHFAAFFALRPSGRECPFSALDDEEFFVVEGSGWRGRRESDSQLFCHSN